MFESIKDKLKRFKKTAEKEIEDRIEDELEEMNEEEAIAAIKATAQEMLQHDVAPKEISEASAVETAEQEKKDETSGIDGMRIPGEISAPTQPSDAVPEETLIQELPEGSAAPQEAHVPGISKKMRTLLSKREIYLKEKDVDAILWELEVILLESDVALPVIEAVKKDVKKELLTTSISLRTDIDNYIENALKNAISHVLSKPFDFDDYVKKAEKPVVIMFVGINGTGKTTAIARIAHRLKNQRYGCVIAASDTFRAGAIEQLEIHAERLDVKLIKHKAGSDPAAVAYDAIEHAKARKKEVVLIDTAGRIQTNVNLMDEMKKIKRIAEPNLIIFVGDSLAGNDAVDQAQKFDEAVGIDGVILTKIDADAKGGSALSIAYSIGKPILFLGTGQNYEDLTKFDPNWLMERLFEKT